MKTKSSWDRFCNRTFLWSWGFGAGFSLSSRLHGISLGEKSDKFGDVVGDIIASFFNGMGLAILIGMSIYIVYLLSHLDELD